MSATTINKSSGKEYIRESKRKRKNKKNKEQTREHGRNHCRNLSKEKILIRSFFNNNDKYYLEVFLECLYKLGNNTCSMIKKYSNKKKVK